MKIRGSFVAICVLALSIGIGHAEEPAEIPMPELTPEHKKLEVWVGEWSGSGEMKPGPFGPGGPMNWTEKCSWFGDTGFHIVCKSEGTGPMGPSKGLGIISYNTEKKVYTHVGIDTGGWMGISEGTLSGNDWTFQSKETMGDKTYHSRFTMKMDCPSKMAFQWEMSEDGENWAVMMDGTSAKKCGEEKKTETDCAHEKKHEDCDHGKDCDHHEDCDHAKEEKKCGEEKKAE